MTKPDAVFEAMVSAALDAEADYELHSADESPICPMPVIIEAALRAARELGYEIVPKYLSEDFEAKINPKYRQAVTDGSRLAVLCATNIIGGD